MRLTSTLMRRVGEWSKKYSNLPDSYIERAMAQVCTISFICLEKDVCKKYITLYLSIIFYIYLISFFINFLTLLLFKLQLGLLENPPW